MTFAEGWVTMRTMVKLGLLIAVSGVVFVSGCSRDGPTAAKPNRPSTTTMQVATTQVAATCDGSSAPSTEDIRGLANAVLGSPYYQVLDTGPLDSVDEVVTDGSVLAAGPVTAVRAAEQQPFNIIPGPFGETSSAAGNTAVWTGVELDVATPNYTVTVAIPLLAGGPDVVASMRAVSAKQLSGLVGACAAVVSSQKAGPGVLGGSRLIAAASSLDSPPVALDPSLQAAVEKSKTLREIVDPSA